MKARSRFAAAAVGLAALLLVAGCASNARTAAGAEARSSLPEFVSMISGRFQGTTPGNGLRLDVSTLGARVGTRFDVFLTASGRYGDRNVRRTGLLRLETQGQTVHAAYVPHFDATVTPLSREATRFTQEELRSACDLFFAPSGDGYVGETRGSTSCAQALPGAVGKWTVEVDPAGIRIRNVGSGETLRFSRER